VGWFVDASIVNGLVHTGLHYRYIELLDSLHAFLKESEASPQNPSASHGRDTLCDGPSGSHIAERERERER
jgi:hypothetical protein